MASHSFPNKLHSAYKTRLTTAIPILTKKMSKRKAVEGVEDEPAPKDKKLTHNRLADFTKLIHPYLTSFDRTALAKLNHHSLASTQTALSTNNPAQTLRTCINGIRFEWDTIYIQLFGDTTPQSIRIYVTSMINTQHLTTIGSICQCQRLKKSRKRHIYSCKLPSPPQGIQELVVHGGDISATRLTLYDSNWLGTGGRYQAEMWEDQGIDETVHFLATRATSNTIAAVLLIPIRVL